MDDFNKLPKELADLDVESEIVKDYIIEQVVKENWYMVYLISQLVSREVSILNDSNDNIWVDWGTVGRVKLSPPIGSTLPFKLWVHTHPSNTAYWSITDRNSLDFAKGILEKAIVLGENGLLSSSTQAIISYTGDTVVETQQWTEEQVVSWFEYYCQDLEIYDSKWFNN